MTAVQERYGIYFTPDPKSSLWRLGCHWLGRDPARPQGGLLPPPPDIALAGLSEDIWFAATAEARRYGFHATLKPPFALAEGRDLADLDGALARFAAGRRPFVVPPLAVRSLDGFLALCPADESSELDDLAATCVRVFDAFRRPPSAAELLRRRARDLTPRQDAHLETWGYPYVMEDFRFHMTLTDRLDDDIALRFQAVLDAIFKPVASSPLTVGGVALFREAEPGAPFELLRRYLFSAS
tara:strand:+ start:156 stop:875 length:720 start_codon:yes stop_codon:yes gene_type:complete